MAERAGDIRPVFEIRHAAAARRNRSAVARLGFVHSRRIWVFELARGRIEIAAGGDQPAIHGNQRGLETLSPGVANFPSRSQ